MFFFACGAKLVSPAESWTKKGKEMTIITKELNGLEIAYSFDPEHKEEVTGYYTKLVAEGFIRSYRVI